MDLSEELNLDLRNVAGEFHRHLDEVSDEEPRWKYCIGNTLELKYGLGYMYVKNHFSLHGKEKASQVFLWTQAK